MFKTALITGITGQDGSYLAELLLGERYAVHGVVRRSSSIGRERIDTLGVDDEARSRLHLHYGDSRMAAGSTASFSRPRRTRCTIWVHRATWA